MRQQMTGCRDVEAIVDQGLLKVERVLDMGYRHAIPFPFVAVHWQVADIVVTPFMERPG
jgi:hypothetical protein